MSKPHAIHNEKACELLLSNGGFNDWVVTTAFYSSLHYTEHQIFPLIVGATTYNSFNEFYDSVLKSRKVSKHNGKMSLVVSNLPCGAQYRWLMDACMLARYIDYTTSPDIANKAKECLDIIKSYITKP